MVLLDIVHNLAKYQNWDIAVAYLDHGLRPNSNRDLETIREFTAKKKIRIFEKKIDVNCIKGDAMIPCGSVSLIHLRTFLFPKPGSISIGTVPALNKAKTIEMNLIPKGTKSKIRSPFLNPYWFNPEAVFELLRSNS